jgi:hypothetical protein
MGIVLFLVAVVIKWVLFPFAVLYNVVNVVWNYPLKMWYKCLERDAYRAAYSIDQQGNTMYHRMLNDFFIKRTSADKFGNPDETISSVLGKNKLTDSLTGMGILLANILDALDKNHVTKSIEQNNKPSI